MGNANKDGEGEGKKEMRSEKFKAVFWDMQPLWPQFHNGPSPHLVDARQACLLDIQDSPREAARRHQIVDARWKRSEFFSLKSLLLLISHQPSFLALFSAIGCHLGSQLPCSIMWHFIHI